MTTTASHSTELPQTSLYVGDLHPKVTEHMLYQKFVEIGPVMSVKVCMDIASRESLGYGYVNFQDPKDAERALENLNYDFMEGRPIRIMWSHRDPSLRKSGKGNVFIKNLDKAIEQKELYDTFRFFGKILSCKIACDEAGNSKGYGFVHFATEESANAAIKKLNSVFIQDRPIYVGKFIPSSERKSKGGKSKFNNCYVKNFSTEYDDEWLKKLFSEFGEIKSAVVAKDENGASKGFGFVCFHDPENAEKAVLALNSKKLDEQNLYVTKALRKEERQEELRQRAEKQRQERQSKYDNTVNLYVKNLDETVDDDKLREVFAKYGTITSAKVMRDQNGSRLFGFVCFEHPEEAACAVSEMNNAIVGSKPLYVAIAQRKEARRAQLVAEHQKRMTSSRQAFGSIHPSVNPTAFYPYLQRQYGSVMNQPRWRSNQLPMGPHPGAASSLNPVSAVAGTNARVAAYNNYAASAQAAQLQAPAHQTLGGMASLSAMGAIYRTPQAALQQAAQQHSSAQQQQVQQSQAAAVAAAAAANRQSGMMQAAGGAQTGNAGMPMSAMNLQATAPGQTLLNPLTLQHQNALTAQQRTQLQVQQQQQRSAVANMQIAHGLQIPQQQSVAAAQQQQNQQVSAAHAQPVAQANQNQQQNVQQVANAQHHMIPAGMNNAAPPRPSMAEVAGRTMTGQHARIIQNQQQSGVRFISNARNVSQNTGNQLAQAQQVQQTSQQQGVLASMAGDAGPVSMSLLAQMPDKKQKDFLGNSLFHRIEKRYKNLAGKLTGMLLEMESADILHMLESDDALQTKLEEAISVINERSQTNAAQNASSGDNNAENNRSAAGQAGQAGAVGTNHAVKGGKKHENQQHASAVNEAIGK